MDLFPVGHFSDISAAVAENFGVDKAMIGESFLDKLVQMSAMHFLVRG